MINETSQPQNFNHQTAISLDSEQNHKDNSQPDQLQSQPIEQQIQQQKVEKMQLEQQVQPEQEQQLDNEQPDQCYQYSNQYDQYNLDGNDNDYDINEYDYDLDKFDKKLSSQENKQYQMEDLVKIIQKQVKNVMQLTGFHKQWALIYFQSCGWKNQLVIKFIDEQNTHLKLINFLKEQQAKTQIHKIKGTCQICLGDDLLLIKNLCGHIYCQDCWKGLIMEKLKTFNKDPFPPCMNDECKNRISPSISQHFSRHDNQFKRLYYRTLCRSYAYGNPQVKLCKGRQGYSCDKCFKIKKISELIQCEHCGNFVCGKCGQQYHQPSQCFDKKNWSKLADQAFINFEMNNNTACPTCKQLIHKYVGCNYIRCICKQQFCYVCGQKWLPNHCDHFNCYRAKQMGNLLIQKQKKLMDEQKYLQQLQKQKKQIVKYDNRIRQVDRINIKELQNNLVNKFKILSNEFDYLKRLQVVLKIGLLIMKNIRISKYFKNEEALKLESLNIEEILDEVQNFIINKLNTMIKSAQTKQKQTIKDQSDRIFFKGELISPKQQLKKDKQKMIKHLKFLQKCIHQL